MRMLAAVVTAPEPKQLPDGGVSAEIMKQNTGRSITRGCASILQFSEEKSREEVAKSVVILSLKPIMNITRNH